MKTVLQLALTSFVFLALFSCEKQVSPVSGPLTSGADAAKTALALRSAAALTTIVENFETGTKAAYADGTVTLSTGVWDFDDALLGNLSTDHKDGAQCARIRNTGMMTMDFDFHGVSALSVAGFSLA